MALAYFQESLCGSASMTPHPFTTKLQMLPNNHQVPRPEKCPDKYWQNSWKYFQRETKANNLQELFLNQLQGRKKCVESLSVEITAAVKMGNRVLGITVEGVESKTADSILLSASPLWVHCASTNLEYGAFLVLPSLKENNNDTKKGN